jgi:hypothetical protein
MIMTLTISGEREPATGDNVLGQACGWRLTLRAAAVAWATPPGS